MLLELKYEDSFEDILYKIDNTFKGYVSVVNLNILTNMYYSHAYREIILSSEFCLCDSINAWILNQIFGRRRIKKYPGPDLMKDILCSERFDSVFIGGEAPQVTGFLAKLTEYDSRVSIEDIIVPPILSVEEFDYPGIAETINKRGPDIIWVGLGAPKQEYFINNILPYLNKGVLIGVGAAFDFYSGDPSKKRAPAFIRNIHMEWFYRALNEPKRIIPRQARSLVALPKIVISEIFR